MKKLSVFLFALLLAAAVLSLGTVACTPVVQSQTGNSGTISINDLPLEARHALQLIENGGPFPYRQDGSTFSNREGLLPQKPNGYYHEYTVYTPGSTDRGARRIIAGQGGEYYYTDDHYASFRRILE